MSWGGKRIGGGRPKRDGESKIKVSAQVKKEVVEKLTREAEENNMSLSFIVNRKLSTTMNHTL